MKSVSLAFSACLALMLASPTMAQMGPPQPLPPEVLVDTPDTAAVAWLHARVVAQGPVLGGLAFTFPASFYGSRLFLVAESHGSAAPQVFDLELLTHLNARIGLTDYVAEVDPVQGELLNTYLDSGDEAALARVFAFWSASGAQWGNASFEAKVRAIRALNQTLSAERRIRFIGIDAIQDWPLLLDFVTARGGVIDAEAWTAANARARAALAADALTGHADDALGRRLLDLLSRTAKGSDRENAIFETYAYAVRSGELANRPAYGLWGMFHALQGPVNGVLPFAARVARSDLPSHDRITTIALLSLDSAVQIPVPLPTGLQRMRLTEFNIDGPFVKVQGSATLRAASDPNRITVFNLASRDAENANGPIRAGDFLTLRTTLGQNFQLDAALPTSAYAQYIGAYRGSDWAPPLETP